MKEVRLSPAAASDLDRIWDYTADRWGIEQAIVYTDMLEDRIEGLGTGRTSSRRAEGVRAGLFRALAGEHVVFFRTSETAIEVIRMLHQSMDTQSRLG